MKNTIKKIKNAILISIFICGIIGIKFSVNAAPLKNIPHTLTQPDGQKIECFVSGDEYFNYIHDGDGNIIIKNHDTGKYVYAKIEDGGVIPGEDVVEQSNVLKQGKGINTEKIKFADIPKDYIRNIYESSPLNQDSAIETYGLDHNGYKEKYKYKWKNKTVNNIVIFIDFPDVIFSNKTSEFYDKLFNGDEKSLKNWFDEVSYGKAKIISSMFPKTSGTTIAAYRDIHNRSFYEPEEIIDKTNNEVQYIYHDENGAEVNRADLEHPLLKRAIRAVKGQIPESLDIDVDNDNFVDCITFIIAGNSNIKGNVILWSHQWSLYTENETINGKRAYEYALVMENELEERGANVLMHETFHIYGAPDLYHYYDNIEPVGSWEIMATSDGQMTNMYMKYKYGGWIDEILEIESSGTYTLNKTSKQSNNCYVIRTPFSGDEFFVLEFRTKEGYDNIITGSGLVVYRIDSRFEGNGEYSEDKAIFDEVFVAETSPEKRYYPSYGKSTTLKLRSGRNAGITIDNFSIAGDKISFRVQLTSPKVAKYFKDYRVALAIADQLGKEVDEITDSDLLKITELKISPVREYGLSLNLEGMEKLKNLQKFTAEKCKIVDLSPLSGLTGLTQLNLYHNNIVNISALTNLKSLKSLSLRGNLITDYSPVKSYYNNLATKDFSLNKLGDIHFRVSNYDSSGEPIEIKVDITDTVPRYLYLKLEKYTDTGLKVKETELSDYKILQGENIKFNLPSEYKCEDGYVIIKGYERADFKQLCAELIVHPVRFKLF